MSATGRWFRIYDETLDDPRLQRLPASLFRAWVNLLCVASRCGGTLPGIEEISFMLRSRPAAVARRIEALKAAGLIEERDGALVPTDWERRQFVSANDRPSPADPTAAERMRRFRERAAERNGAVTPTVTNAPLEEDIPLEKDSQTAPAARESATDVFDEFWQAFPSRDGDNPEQPALDSFRKAVAAGADPKAIILGAKAYASATAGRERRYIASAARWLGERRWQGETQPTLNPNLDRPISRPAPGVWISTTSPEWRAWADHWRATKGKSPPIDAKGGWRFSSLTPPQPQPLAA